MRLAAVYFPNNSFSYLFGEGHKGFIINLGGSYFYNTTIKDEVLNISRVKNEQFINDFWGENISLISAIVGKNGIGKTSFLRAIHKRLDKKHRNVLYLIEDENRVFIYNEIEYQIESDFDLKEFAGNAFENVKMYYTPIIDVEQVNIFSDLNLVWDEQKNLNQLYLKQMLQDVRLLNDPVVEELKKVYPDFPLFKKLKISVSQHKKFSVKSVHGATNTGTLDRITVLTNYINKDIMDLEEGRFDDFISPQFVKEHFLERYRNIAKSTGLISLYDRLWELPEYSIDMEDKLHSENDFLKNFEITLLTYLIIDATFPQTPFQGASFEFQSIVDSKTFEDRFDAFMEYYFVRIYEIVTEQIKGRLGRVSIKDYEKIKKIIKEPNHTKWTQSGFKSSDAVELMSRYLERFKAYFDLYVILKETIDKKKFEIHDGYFVYELGKHNESDFVKIIEAYEKLDELSLGLVYTLDLLSIKSDYPISSGEKSLINFFSRINERVNKMKTGGHPIFDFNILLLDEAELGFHPIWKRKFVNAISKCLPIIFKKLTPNKSLIGDDAKIAENLKLQIIFTTHDPLTLSDIPINNVTFINQDRDTNNSFLIDKKKVIDLATFGANVHDILAHSFFLENGFMGEFAEGMIKSLIRHLTEETDKDLDTLISLDWDKTTIQKFINAVDEPFIKERLSNLYDEKYFLNNRKALEDRKAEIEARLKEMDDEED